MKNRIILKVFILGLGILIVVGGEPNTIIDTFFI